MAGHVTGEIAGVNPSSPRHGSEKPQLARKSAAFRAERRRKVRPAAVLPPVYTRCGQDGGAQSASLPVSERPRVGRSICEPIEGPKEGLRRARTRRRGRAAARRCGGHRTAPGGHGRRRRLRRCRGPGAHRGQRLRRRRAGPGPPGGARRRRLPQDRRARHAHPGAYAHRVRRRQRPGRGPGAGRGRLSAQALRLQRADRPGARAGPPYDGGAAARPGAPSASSSTRTAARSSATRWRSSSPRRSSRCWRS